MRITGAAAEMIVVSDLILKGYEPYLPTMGNTECDVLVEKDGKAYRVQVKSARSEDGEKVKFDITRPSASSKHYSKDDFDILALHDFYSGKTAYLVWRDLPHKRSITLRYSNTVDSNAFVGANGRLFFDDYLEFPEIITKEIAG
ncbi:group I intron-associated PD-(D/E)XK endonuclease [Bacillus licheniformis]|uniref:group I intron-associated PD-(D/E)XK endonuclease n=1 Tax=Bacillus licheniformis TaxID=1402 RepID=UPI0021BD346F|nr:group I intron-associated PD-(D/E)XK endonuclease [Bacillus licheniformis]